MTIKVFIDGEAGTTGLQIHQRLASRRDIELLQIAPEHRKDEAARAQLLNAADVAILCLPDDAARAALRLVNAGQVKVIDASTAHRVSPDWVYGFPEMRSGQREAIRSAKRVSNPGCYPTAFIALVAPLVRAGLIHADFPLTVNAVSGYSGGGKGLMEEFTGPTPQGSTDAFRPYGLSLAHKHAPEMTLYASLYHPPVFAPSVGRYAQGMIVEVPLQLWALPGKPAAADLRETLAAAYTGERFVQVADEAETAALQKARAGAGGYVEALDPEALNGSNCLKLYVFGNEALQQARLVAVLDNLGKGASGAAVQSLNLMCGFDEGEGL
jgi:N-acetyl-gamma-glutamyl-phosphate reductase